MKLEAVIIRTFDQIRMMDENLVKGLTSIKPFDKIPLIYNYLHNPNNELVIDNSNRIGTVTNVRVNDKGDIVGDIDILDILKLASNFEGVIDNIAASINPTNGEVTVNAFIIYDIVAKNKIKEGKRLKHGEIPLMSTTDPEMMKEVSEKLVEEYKNLIEKQTGKSK